MATCDSQGRCVFVGNIPYNATEEQLIQICEEVGPVVSFRLVIDKETGKPKGYGFCEYKDEETALSARRNLQGYAIRGRKLRVQGRGAPGIVTSLDPKKHIGGPAFSGDSAVHQPTGMSVAMTAAEAVMARALGAAQTGSLFSQSVVDDPLTLYMSKLSKSYLIDIMSEFKTMCVQNKEQTRQLLLAIPNLSKALFQAQLILGMVTQPKLQMPNIPQPAAPQLQPDSHPSQQLATQSLPGLPPLLQARPQIQLPQPVQTQTLPAPSMPPSMQPPPVQVATSSSVKQPMQPAFLQQAGQAASMNFSSNDQPGTTNTNYHHPSLMCPPLSEQGFQGNPSAVSGVLDNINKDPWRPRAPNNLSLMTKPAYSSGFPKEKRGATDNLDHLSRPSKLPRLDDGANYVSPGASASKSLSGPPTQVSAAEEVSNSDKLASQPQLPLEIDSALLKQVMSLTPEQLSSLPPDQKQQVIQLQQMLQQAA